MVQKGSIILILVAAFSAFFKNYIKPPIDLIGKPQVLFFMMQ